MIKMMQTADEIKLDLIGRLGEKAITKSIWDYLLEEGFVDRVCRAENKIDWLADRVVKVLQAAGRLPQIFDKRSPTIDEAGKTQRQRPLVLSVMMAQEAAKIPEVIEFRKNALRSKLLASDQVEDWIKLQASKEGGASHWIGSIPLPDDTHLRMDASAGHFAIEPPLTVRGAFSAESRFLKYGLPNSEWTFCHPIRRGGVLERLREVSQDLAKRYDWQEAVATLFVLTGRTPLVSPLSYAVCPNGSPFKRRVITMEIDPILSPSEIARQYSKIRRAIMPNARTRDLSEKHLKLAAFFLEEARDDSWEQRLRSWNKSHPKWKYSHQSNFRRDCLRACSRISAPAYSPLSLAKFASSDNSDVARDEGVAAKNNRVTKARKLRKR